MNISLIIGTVGFILSLITFVRLFLLDKKSGEFIIDDIDGRLMDLEPRNIIIGARIPKSQTTSVRFNLKMIKSNLFKIKMSGIKGFQINNDKNENDISFSRDVKEINIVGDSISVETPLLLKENKEIKITFEDELGNSYQQIIQIEPQKNSIKITSRKWFFWSSTKKRYVEFF